MAKDNKQLRTFVKRFINPVLRYLARLSPGPFALLRHVGRSSGKTYEIPMMVWPVKDGFVIVLTYGPHVDWLRNLQAAGQGSLRWHGREYTFQRPQAIDAQTALPALPPFIKFVMQRRGAKDFVKLPGN
ncbi:peptidase [Dictyobacter alpinus]|uniref:Peptidase n=1 Tax=Dictyobacter alpinus TaxID=2014873 RepID=A0A402BCL4_9CHLR|nr:nitroreductase family deazaflavin-dependent oxidoreductase [Dictyobacter alpinus]GCE29076.1 peptidase [Dictyobacter alpinus]